MAKVTFYRKRGLFGPKCSDILSSTRPFLPSLPRHQHQLLIKHLNAGDWAGEISFNPHNQALGLLYKEALMLASLKPWPCNQCSGIRCILLSYSLGCMWPWNFGVLPMLAKCVSNHLELNSELENTKM